MKKYLINNNSDNLLLFFSGWGCDEFEFEHLSADCDILILYDYIDLNLDFDFKKYKKIDVLAFSAGGFIASLFNYSFKLNRVLALSSNPYLFDEELGLSKKVQDLLMGITIENADDFAKNYLVKTESEIKRFHHSRRTIESCSEEFNSLKKLYELKKNDIKDIFNCAIIGADDEIFDIEKQKEFYGSRLKIIPNARHSLFFRIEKYEDIFDLTM